MPDQSSSAFAFSRAWHIAASDVVSTHEGASWIHWLTLYIAAGGPVQEGSTGVTLFRTPQATRFKTADSKPLYSCRRHRNAPKTLPPREMEYVTLRHGGARPTRGPWLEFVPPGTTCKGMPSSPPAWRERKTAKTMRPLKRSTRSVQPSIAAPDKKRHKRLGFLSTASQAPQCAHKPPMAISMPNKRSCSIHVAECASERVCIASQLWNCCWGNPSLSKILLY